MLHQTLHKDLILCANLSLNFNVYLSLSLKCVIFDVANKTEIQLIFFDLVLNQKQHIESGKDSLLSLTAV